MKKTEYSFPFHLICSLLFLIFLAPLRTEAVRKIEISPINLAAILIERPDSSSIASTCEYYGYTIQSSQNGNMVFRHDNGSSILISFNDSDNSKMGHSVEVTSNTSRKVADKNLKSLNFQKIGNNYERRSIGYLVRVFYGPHGTLTFQKYPKEKEE